MKLQNIIAMVTFHAKILDTINKSKPTIESVIRHP